MDQVVAPDGERVPVPRHHPHVQLRVARLEARGDGRRPAVDAVHAVGVHVVREAPRTPDATDEHDVLLVHPQVRQQALHGGQDGVVAAPGAPAHLLVGLEVLAGQGLARPVAAVAGRERGAVVSVVITAGRGRARGLFCPRRPGRFFRARGVRFAVLAPQPWGKIRFLGAGRCLLVGRALVLIVAVIGKAGREVRLLGAVRGLSVLVGVCHVVAHESIGTG